MISKHEILQKVTDYQIMNYFLYPFHSKGRPLKQGEHITNPIVLKQDGVMQKTPSFNLVRFKGMWFFKDFAESWCQGDAFKLVMYLFGVDFTSALNIINEQMSLGLESNNTVSHIDMSFIEKCKEIEAKEDTNIYDYWIQEREIGQYEMDFWKQYGDVIKEDLDLYNVKSLDYFKAYSNRKEKYYTVKRKEGEIIFFYDMGSWGKIYMPYAKQMRFITLGKREPVLFGYRQLQGRDILVLTGGEKDVITLHVHGYDAVAMNSEESNVENYEHLEWLLTKSDYRRKAVLYDNDATGRREARKIAQKYNIENWTEKLSRGYDISEYYKSINK